MSHSAIVSLNGNMSIFPIQMLANFDHLGPFFIVLVLCAIGSFPLNTEWSMRDMCPRHYTEVGECMPAPGSVQVLPGRQDAAVFVHHVPALWRLPVSMETRLAQVFKTKNLEMIGIVTSLPWALWLRLCSPPAPSLPQVH